MIIFGNRLFGKVDAVPGRFHVATMFLHIYYLPLIPWQSYVVLWEHDGHFKGIPVRLKFKSIGAAWLRTLAVLLTIGGALALLALCTKPGAPGRGAIIWTTIALLGGALSVAFAFWHPAFTRATPERERILAEEAQLAPWLGTDGSAQGGSGFPVMMPSTEDSAAKDDHMIT